MASVHQIGHLDNNITKIEEDGIIGLSLNTKSLTIIWGGEGSKNRYWRKTAVTDDEDEANSHEAAELVGVYWLEITGKIPLSFLSPGTTYNFFITLKITENAYGWKNNPVIIRIDYPGNNSGRSAAVDLSECLDGVWVDVPADEGIEFTVPRDNNIGMISFAMYEFEGEDWKKGVIIKEVKFVPQLAKLRTII